jgi:hypothetical protein
MSTKGLTEYLYCDEHSLDSYFEQISHPVAYDKVPVWKAALSLTGPTAGCKGSGNHNLLLPS